ncbi:MAG: hypothetical protein FWD04_08525 [Conexibacteraceae bacterium]|nr:hypothetical protein [Conexibacteraceae bacterium]
MDLPRCVKTRVPDATTADLRRSPWGAVLEIRFTDSERPYLWVVAFGLRHPETVGSARPSVYQLAHERL